MLALITNDDGVDGRGIAELSRAAHRCGFDVLVAAPSWDSSGAAASLTAAERGGRMLFEDRVIDGVDGRVVAVEAAPAFIVRSALSGAFGEVPDLVLSGVNHGPNTGHAVLHSGTVGAASTAAVGGLPAAAFSLDTDGGGQHWDTAAEVLDQLLVSVQWPRHRGVVINVNIPDVPRSQVRGVRMARLATVGAVTATVTEVGEGYVRINYTPATRDTAPGTDVALLDRGFATVSVLDPVAEHEDWTVEGVEGASLANSG